jgi:hypothetical protein
MPLPESSIVTWEKITTYCDGRKDDCHELIAAQFENAVNKALDAKLSEKGIIFMSKYHYVSTILLGIGTGFGGREAVKFLASIAGIKVGP